MGEVGEAGQTEGSSQRCGGQPRRAADPHCPCNAPCPSQTDQGSSMRVVEDVWLIGQFSQSSGGLARPMQTCFV